MILSIIIPVYNVENYLKRCVNSVVGKNEDDVEIILVDDGSTDSSAAICDDYARLFKNVCVVHQKNGGLSAARNTGIKTASGQYLAFLDSDDMFEEYFIQDMLDIIDKYKPDMITFSCCQELKLNEYRISGNKNISNHTWLDYYELILKNKIGSQICFHIYSRRLFDNIMFPLNCHYEDIRVFWSILYRASKIIDVDYSYYIYNLTNQGSITKSVSVKSLNDMKMSIDIMVDGILSKLKLENVLNDELAAKAEYARLNGYIYILYKLIRYNRDSELKNELIGYVKCQHLNLFKYRNYDWKKFLLCKMLIITGLIK